VIVVLDTVPVTLAGLAGLVPYTYFSASCVISSRRHRQSDTVEIRVPFSLVKGSGSFATEGSEPGSATGQSAPSSSTGDVRPPAAVAVLAMVVTAPVPVSAATASRTTTHRKRRRFDAVHIRAPSDTVIPGAWKAFDNSGQVAEP
jgi:hypothetical protein